MQKHVLIIAMVLVSSISNGQITPNLNSLSQYALLAQDSIVSDLMTAIGKAGSNSGISVLLNAYDGKEENGAGNLSQAHTDLDSLIAEIYNLSGQAITGNLNGISLSSGVYEIIGNTVISDSLILTGNDSSVFIFKVTDSLIVDSNAIVYMQGVKPSNIYWLIDAVLARGNSSINGILICNGNVKIESLQYGSMSIYSKGSIRIENTNMDNYYPCYQSHEILETYFVAIGGGGGLPNCNLICNGDFETGGIPIASGGIVNNLAACWSPIANLQTLCGQSTGGGNQTPDLFDENTTATPPLQIARCAAVCGAWNNSQYPGVPQNFATCSTPSRLPTTSRYAGIFPGEAMRNTINATLNQRVYFVEFYASAGDCMQLSPVNNFTGLNNVCAGFSNALNPTIPIFEIPFNFDPALGLAPPAWTPFRSCFDLSQVNTAMIDLFYFTIDLTPFVDHSRLLVDDFYLVQLANAGPDQQISCANPCVTIGTSCNPAVDNNSADVTMTYLWSNGATTAQTTVCSPGTYTVTATITYFDHFLASNQSCTDQDQVVVTQIGGGQLAITTSVTDVCPDECNGSVTANITSGTAPFTFLWSNGQTANPAINLCAGTYTVTVTDANGCSGTATATVNQHQPPNVSISGNLSFCTGSSTQLTANPAGNSFSWSTGATTQSISVSASGTYTVTVTDANGCTGTAAVAVTVFSNPTVSISGNSQICTSVPGTLNANAAGNGPFQFVWSTGSTQQSISVSSAGTYTVTITDQNGCTGSASVSVNYDPGFTINIACTNGCNGTSKGSASVTSIIGNIGNTYTYLWNTGATTSSINSLQTGTYTVTVTNQNGCTMSASCSLISVALPGSITINGDNSNCERDFVPHYYSISPYNSLLDNYYSWTIDNHYSANFPGNDNNDASIIWNPCEGGTITVTLAIPGCQPVTSTLIVQRCCGCYDDPITTGTTVTQLATAMNLPLDQTQQYFVLETQSPIYFNGDFIMDANLIIRNSPDVRFGPGAAIINTDHRLSIESSHLGAGCQVMWRGIIMRRVNSIDGGAADMQKEVGNPVLSVIEDAHIAFDMARGCKLGLHDNSVLNRNYIGVQVKAINNLLPYDPLEITSASFDCSSALYPPYPGQSPVPNSNSYTGIHLSSCAYVSIGDNAQTPISFNNLHYGIYSLRSNLDVYKCTFTNMQDYGYLTSSIKGVGIYAYGGNDEGSNQYYIHQYGHGKNGPLSFSNCRIGIYTDKMMAYLYDNHMNPVNVGVEVKESIYSEVFFNKIHAFSSPTLQARGVNLTANIPLSATSIKVYGNDLIIGQGTTSAGVYVNGAIGNPYSAIIGNQPAGNGNTITMNGARYGIFGLTSNLLTTVNNTIDMNFGYNNSACFGIYLQRCPRSQHAFNTITGFGTPSVTNNINGFYVTDCAEGLYFCNHTDNLMRGFWYNTSCQNSWLMGNNIGSAETGLYLTNTAVIGAQFNGTDYNGNLWTGNYSLFGALSLNSIGSSQFRVELGGNPQNMPPTFSPPGWFQQFPGNDFDECNAWDPDRMMTSNESLDELIASDSALTTDFVDEVKYISQTNLFAKLLESDSLLNANPLLTSFFNDSEQSPIGYFEDIRLNLRNIYQLTIANDSITIAESAIIDSLYASISQWEQLLIDSALSGQDSLLIIQTMESMTDEIYNRYLSIDSLKTLNLQLRNNELTLIGIQNNSIQAIELYNKNRQMINKLKLETVYNGVWEFTVAQADSIFSIASQCAVLGGPAVYEARGLYALIDGSAAFDDYEICIPFGFERKSSISQAGIQFVQLMPNPATGMVTFKFESDTENTAVIELINQLGQTVHILPIKLKQGMNSFQADYNVIAPGVYRYCIKSKNITSGKLVLIRKK